MLALSFLFAVYGQLGKFVYSYYNTITIIEDSIGKPVIGFYATPAVCLFIPVSRLYILHIMLKVSVNMSIPATDFHR